MMARLGDMSKNCFFLDERSKNVRQSWLRLFRIVGAKTRWCQCARAKASVSQRVTDTGIVAVPPVTVTGVVVLA